MPSEFPLQNNFCDRADALPTADISLLIAEIADFRDARCHALMANQLRDGQPLYVAAGAG